MADVADALIPLRGHMAASKSGMQNIYGVLVRHDDRLERIARRPDLCEPAEPSAPFRPGP